MNYQGPIGKAQTLESFRDLTPEFIVLDYADPNFEERAMNFVMDNLDDTEGHYGTEFLLRSAATFEGLLPEFSYEHKCWVGRTFAGLMDSPSLDVKKESDFNDTLNYIETLKHQTASRLFHAGGGSDLERRIFDEYKSKINFDQMGEIVNGAKIHYSKLVETLKKYSMRRGIDLRSNNMRFILQKRVKGKLFHVMEHPNFEDILIAESPSNDFDNDYKFPVFAKHSTELEKRNRNRPLNDKFSRMYKEVTRPLHFEFTYLLECIVGTNEDNSEEVIPVQATPIFRKRKISNDDMKQLILYVGECGTSFLTDFKGDLKLNDYKLDRYEGRNSYQSQDLDFSGQLLINTTGRSITSHFGIRSIEGIQGLGKLARDLLE